MTSSGLGSGGGFADQIHDVIGYEYFSSQHREHTSTSKTGANKTRSNSHFS